MQHISECIHQNSNGQKYQKWYGCQGRGEKNSTARTACSELTRRLRGSLLQLLRVDPGGGIWTGMPASHEINRWVSAIPILRELGQVAIGDILLETTDGRQLALRRVARPKDEPARILAALKLEMPERLSNDRVL